MADEWKYILDLAVATTVDDNALIIVQDADETKRMTFGAMKKVLGATGGTEATKLQEKSVTPTKQSQTIVPDYGYDGLSKITVKPISDDYIQPKGIKNITENGTYDVTEYASVGVEVQETTDAQIATSTTPGNVMPVAKTDEMTQEVGVDESGRLYTKSPSLPENTLTGDQVANLHVWERFGGSGEITLLDPAGFTLYSYPSGTGAIYSITIYYSDTCGIVNGAVTLDAPHTLTYKTNEALSKLETLRGKYVKTYYKDTCYLVAEGATFSSKSVSGTISITAIKCSSAQEVTDVSYGDLLGYVTAASRDTYPEAGIQDGYRYEYCGTIGGGVAPPTDTIEEGNPNPVTSGAVAAQFGNIEAALDAMIEKAGGTA